MLRVCKNNMKCWCPDTVVTQYIQHAHQCQAKAQSSRESRKMVKVKIKSTLVQALRLCTGRTAHSGSRGIALLFHDHDTRKGWGVRVTPRPLFTPGKDPVTIIQEAGWAPGPVWTGAENLASTGIRSPDRPARSQSLRYPAHLEKWSGLLLM